MAVLSGLEPQGVFRFFEEICAIPHGSGDTKKISDYLVGFAKDRNLRYIQDEANNVIIFKNGSKGYEQSKPVMLQGHMDMVCEKETGCNIDFEKDGLDIQLVDGVISARGTTLGGDDGIAVAYALAILDDDEIPHPPLEVVLTVDEETGMLGAAALDCSSLKSRIMLNLDSEEEGYLLVSCAGGAEAICHLPVSRTESDGRKVKLSLADLTGGHSGVEIDKWRGNANQLMGRILFDLAQKIDYRLIRVDGGLKDNAIPRSCEAELVIREDDCLLAEKAIMAMQETIRHELQSTDPKANLTINVYEDGKYDALTKECGTAIVAALLNMPGGIQRMNPDMPDMVQTSLNMGILKTHNDEVEMHHCVRSSVASEKDAVISRINCLTRLLGGTVEIVGDYPGWEYSKNSPLRDLMIEVFTRQYGHEPVIQALHAGVECGLFADRLPGLDCVSFGPNMKDIHTPAESMEVASVQRTWEYTLEILKNLK